MWVIQRLPQGSREEKNLGTKYREEEHKYGPSDMTVFSGHCTPSPGSPGLACRAKRRGLPLSPTSSVLHLVLRLSTCLPLPSSALQLRALLRGPCPPISASSAGIQGQEADSIPRLSTAPGRKDHFLPRVFYCWVSPEFLGSVYGWSSSVPYQKPHISHPTPRLLPLTSGLGMVPGLH